MVRPEAVELAPRNRVLASAEATRLAGLIEREVFVGGFHRYWIRSDDLELCAKVPSSARQPVFEVGDEVDIVIHAADLLVMED